MNSAAVSFIDSFGGTIAVGHRLFRLFGYVISVTVLFKYHTVNSPTSEMQGANANTDSG